LIEKPRLGGLLRHWGKVAKGLVTGRGAIAWRHMLNPAGPRREGGSGKRRKAKKAVLGGGESQIGGVGNATAGEIKGGEKGRICGRRTSGPYSSKSGQRGSRKK